MSLPKIVVLTPVKNEAWILDRFLSVTSQFADKIIILDQCSTDGSLEICLKYPKVVILENKSTQFNEAERQQILLQAARDIVTEPRIILALDADEILAANALTQPGWQTMLNAKPGTILCFEKPDLYNTPDLCIRHDTPWPIGYADDGAPHTPKQIHSIRVPMPASAPRLNLHDIKVLHYALTREAAQASKMRLYSVLENALRTTPSVLRRRSVYSATRDWKLTGKLESSPDAWFNGWSECGIDTHTIQTQKYYWQDFEVLRHFQIHGERKFWCDDIWGFDWEGCRLHAMSIGVSDVPNKAVTSPPRILGVLLKTLMNFYVRLRTLLNK
ncbi:glycosyltransferase family 2 protein [Deinococcus sp.]|uniref:glycosyltransferase family 2 protein n=1 Tax=Deinococcus sp. TaxID=47478 RepID=UPI0025D17CCC|nr:glycosyltransferase family 2 protein [Deinococcus sp.]